jgi:hypothetical protein
MIHTNDTVLVAEQACSVNAVRPEGLEPPAF